MQSNIAVIGGGIAGLCAALTLAQCGCRVEIFESSDALDDVGAGLQLSPNVTRLMNRIGIAEELDNMLAEPPHLSISSGTDLKTLGTIPMGAEARRRWHAPYGVIHRADLQALLAEAVHTQPLCRLHLGRTFTAASEHELSQMLRDEMDAEPDLIIGADGVWSSMREFAPGAGKATFSGSIAWRGTAKPDAFEPLKCAENVNAFLAPNTHLVTYPLGQRGLVNAVAVTPGRPTARTWATAAESRQLVELFSGWDARVTSALEPILWQCWPLFEVRKTCFRAATKTVLIGDAAHAMTPHAAQGAAMAIEDACALAACFEAADARIERMLEIFEALRTNRIARVRRRGDFNKFAYHAKGPFRLGRDIVFAMSSPEQLAASLDWLYGHDATVVQDRR